MNDLIAERIAQLLAELVKVEKVKTEAIVRFVNKCEENEEPMAPTTGADALTIAVPREDWGKL